MNKMILIFFIGLFLSLEAQAATKNEESLKISKTKPVQKSTKTTKKTTTTTKKQTNTQKLFQEKINTSPNTQQNNLVNNNNGINTDNINILNNVENKLKSVEVINNEEIELKNNEIQIEENNNIINHEEIELSNLSYAAFVNNIVSSSYEELNQETFIEIIKNEQIEKGKEFFREYLEKHIGKKGEDFAKEYKKEYWEEMFKYDGIGFQNLISKDFPKLYVLMNSSIYLSNVDNLKTFFIEYSLYNNIEKIKQNKNLTTKEKINQIFENDNDISKKVIYKSTDIINEKEDAFKKVYPPAKEEKIELQF